MANRNVEFCRRKVLAIYGVSLYNTFAIILHLFHIDFYKIFKISLIIFILIIYSIIFQKYFWCRNISSKLTLKIIDFYRNIAKMCELRKIAIAKF